MVSASSSSACSTRCLAARTRSTPSRSAAARDAGDHRADRGVPDGVEARLQARLGARGDVVGDLGGGQVGGAGVRRVGVRLGQAGGVRAEGAVHEQVAGRADRAEVAHPVEVGRGAHRLGPVAEHPYPGLLGGQRQQSGQVVRGGDLRARALVDRADAHRRRVGQRRALGRAPLRRSDGGVRGGADRVVRRAGERAVGVEAVEHRDAGAPRQRGGGRQRGVHVGAAEVGGPATGGGVEFGAGRRAPLGPAGLVPAVAEQDLVGRAGGGVRGDPGQRVGQPGRGGQVEAGQRQPGGGQVHVRVGERRGDQRAREVDHLVHRVGEAVRGALGADPGDGTAVGDHGGGEGVGGAVDGAAAQQHGAGGALVHGHQSARPAARVRRPG